MIRKFPVIMLIVFLLLVVPAINAQDDDDDPTVLAVTRIDSETIVVDELEDIASPRLYTFIGSEGDIVTLSMIADDPTELDPFLVLLGPAGEVLAANDDVSDSDFSAQIDDFELPFDGAYFVLATTFHDLVQSGAVPRNSRQSLGFQIGLVGATVPPDLEDEEEFEYFSVEMEIGDVVLLEISPEEPVYYVTFFAEEGDVVDIITRENRGDFVNTMLYVFDRFGDRLAVSSGQGDEFYAAIEGLEIPEDGIYLVFATASNFYQAFDDSWQGYGSFVFSIE